MARYSGTLLAYLNAPLGGGPVTGQLGDKYAETFGNGTDTQYTITHNLNVWDVLVIVYKVASPKEVVDCRVEIVSPDSIALRFEEPVAQDSLRVVVK